MRLENLAARIVVEQKISIGVANLQEERMIPLIAGFDQ